MTFLTMPRQPSPTRCIEVPAHTVRPGDIIQVEYRGLLHKVMLPPMPAAVRGEKCVMVMTVDEFGNTEEHYLPRMREVWKWVKPSE